MSNPTKARFGTPLLIKGRSLTFSFWPTYQGTTRVGLQSTLFVLDPWTIINANVKQRCLANAKAEALAYVEQAKDFYNASVSASVAAARPLLLYYCFMNLAKALVVVRGKSLTTARAMHGLKECLNPPNRELIDAFVRAEKSSVGQVQTKPSMPRVQVFDEFLKTISSKRLTADHDYYLGKLLPQILPGHRLWCEATNEDERFIALHEIRVMENKKRKTLWLNLYFFEDDLKRLSVTHKRLLSESRLGASYHQVRTNRQINGRKLVRFEQIPTLSYLQRPSDHVQQLVSTIRPQLWVTVSTIPPYRRHYVYLSPKSESAELLPQLLSIYAVTFYLGSITRYRPHHFDNLIEGPFGPRIEEFISGQPLQFVYMMASEFAEQEVTRPSIV